MILMVFWSSLGLILGALGAFLGALLVFLRAFGGTLHAQNFFFDSFPGQNYVFFWYLLPLPSAKSLFSSCWSLFVSNLSSQADRPTLKNVGFMTTAARFSKNHGFGSKDALDGLLGLSWAHFGCSWGLLGGSSGAFAGLRWHLDISSLLFWRPCGLILPPVEPPTALRAPSERSRWPPEATKKPRETSCGLLF